MCVCVCVDKSILLCIKNDRQSKINSQKKNKQTEHTETNKQFRLNWVYGIYVFM